MSYEEVENYENKSKLEIYKELNELRIELKRKDNVLDNITKRLYDKGLIGHEFYFNNDDFEMRLKRLVEIVKEDMLDKLRPLINTTFLPDEDEMKKFFEAEIKPLIDKEVEVDDGKRPDWL